MSIKVMSEVWELDLPPNEKLVLLAFADFANDDGRCWPALETVGHKCGISQRQTRRYVAKFRDAGLLEVEIAGGGRGMPSFYAVRPAAGVRINPVTYDRKPLSNPVTYDRKSPPETRTPGADTRSPEVVNPDTAMSANPLEPSLEPPLPRERSAFVITSAEELLERWSEISHTPMTRAVRKKAYPAAVDFVASADAVLSENLSEFLLHAYREGCRTVAGLPHFVADWARQHSRRITFDDDIDRLAEWESPAPEDVATALGLEPGESASDMLRRQFDLDQATEIARGDT